MRLYHFLSSSNGLDDLKRRRLKIATLDDINDPFELLAVAGSDSLERQILRNFRRGWSTKFGMLCFSRNWSNPVQWSHYGEKHRGLCLGFDIPDELGCPVTYSIERIKPDWSVIKSDNVAAAHAEMIRWSTTKFEHWQYEEEVRVFLGLEEGDDEGRYWCEFSNNLILREIIVGPSSKIRRKDIQKVLSPTDSIAELFKARLAFQKYRVVRQRRADLWS